MTVTDPIARELASRESAGIQVTLLWQALGNHIWVRVRDARTDEAFSFDVHPADALDAFNHPFAYAPHVDVHVGLSPHATQPHHLERSH